MMKPRYWILLSVLGCLFILTSVATAQEDDPEQPLVSGDNSFCLVCHGEFPVTGLTWEGVTQDSNPHDWTALLHHTHVEGGNVGCVDCHASTIFPHDNEAIPFANWAFAESAAQTCVTCHRDAPEPIQAGCDDCHGESAVNVQVDLSLMNVDISTCEDCHNTTIEEWKHSAHGDQQLACATCHYSHQDKLRFETPEALCLNCHDQDRDSFVHVTHTDESCAECHVYHSDNTAALHVVTGGNISPPTGHDNVVEVAACFDCHEDRLNVAEVDAAPVLGVPDNHPLIEAHTDINALEAELADVREEREGTAMVRFLQSIIIGLAVGGVLTFTFRRFTSQLIPPRDNGNGYS